MNKKTLSVLLIVIMVVCFGVSLSYPIRYFLDRDGNESDMSALRDMRRSALDNSADPIPAADAGFPNEQTDNRVSPTSGSVSTEAAVVESDPVAAEEENTEETKPPQASEAPVSTPGMAAEGMTEEQTTEPGATPMPTLNARYNRKDGTTAFAQREAVEFDPEMILPQYREIYEQNEDLVGWLYMPGTLIDYPVLRNPDEEYYLRRDFYGEDNENGQLIMDSDCDPWTPSYNLVISGHNMRNSTMFGTLSLYAEKSFWNGHKTFVYDSAIREGTYVVFAAFYSADYDVDEEGFRYNAVINYPLDAEVWLEEIRENSEYETGIDVQFGDEFLTLTTCVYHRENGRFVVVARRVREGEVIR